MFFYPFSALQILLELILLTGSFIVCFITITLLLIATFLSLTVGTHRVMFSMSQAVGKALPCKPLDLLVVAPKTVFKWSSRLL